MPGCHVFAANIHRSISQRKRKLTMKIARPTDDDMRRMFDFFSKLEEELRGMQHGFAVEDEKIGALVKKHWGKIGPGVGASWTRVLWGMDTLLRNCTDPDVDTLELRPDIRAMMEGTEA